MYFENQSFKKNFFSYLKKTTNNHKASFYLFVFFYLLFISTYFLIFFYATKFLNVIVQTISDSNRVLYLILAIIFFIIYFLLNYLFTYFTIRITSNFILDLKTEFTYKINSLTIKELENNKNMFLYSKFYTHFVKLEQSLTTSFLISIKEMTSIIILFIVALIFNPILFLSSLIFLPIILVFYILFLKKSIKLNNKITLENSQISDYRYDTYSNNILFKNNELKNIRLSDIKRKENDLNKDIFLSTTIDRLLDSFCLFSSFLSIFFLILFSSIFLNSKTPYANLNITGIGLILMILTTSISNFLISTKELFSSRLSIRIIKEFILSKDDRVEIINKRAFNQIDFVDVNVKFKKKKAISNISLSITKGEKIGIIGQINSAKTLLVSLLLQERKLTSGNIYIDNEDLYSLSRKEIYKYIALIDDNPYIYSTSLRNNITMLKDISEEDLKRVINDVSLNDLISSLPSGLDSTITSFSLSKGEKQKISLARHLLNKDAKVFIFDQAFSDIDIITKQKILKNIYKYLEDKIVIDICFSPDELELLDKLYVLKDGTIVEQGSYEELYNINGFLASFYKAGFDFR